jgi:glutamate/tyrosine decarboxylase-like PLP-dependent enzyme
LGLAVPDSLKCFELYAIGVVLCQIIDDGKERVVGYYSRLLRDAEKKYDTTQKECLAVVLAVSEETEAISVWETVHGEDRPRISQVAFEIEGS